MRFWLETGAFMALAILLAPLPALAQAESLTGPAAVHDADIISINRQRVILWGIDAPEPGQICKINGRDWACRDAAMRQLETLTSRSAVTCYLVGDPDPFGRRHGVCAVGGQDINAEMVRTGMALAYLDQTDDYADEQIAAITAQVGLWQAGVEFLEPWIHRSLATDSTAR